MGESRQVFSDSFAFGVATSAAQSEGGLERSDWHSRERQGIAPPSGRGNGRRLVYREDFTRLSELGLNHFRTSLEWSRIEPEKGLYDREALDEFRRELEHASRAGLKVWLTLQHITLPAWFARMGGFNDASAFMYWHRFVELAAKEFRDLVEFWIPVHEPAAYAAGAYLLGIYPPGRTRMDKFQDFLPRILRAHGDAYRILKAYLPSRAKVGTASLVVPVKPRVPESNRDEMAAHFIDNLLNEITFQALKEGVVTVPGRAPVEISSCKGAADFFGVDYFFSAEAAAGEAPAADPPFSALKECEGMPSFITLREGEPCSDLGWGLCPRGIYDALKRVHQAGLGAPIFITATGAATKEEDLRTKWLVESLLAVLEALEAGIDVRGYLYWTDVDCYEWNQGFNANYGLYGFDPETLARKERPAARVFSRIARERAVPPLQEIPT